MTAMQNPTNASSPRCKPPSHPSLSIPRMAPDVCAPQHHWRRSDTAPPPLLVPPTGPLAPFNYVNGLMHGLCEQEPSAALAYGRGNASVALRPEFGTLSTSVGYPESAQRTQINESFLEHFSFSGGQSSQNLVEGNTVTGNLMYPDQHPRQMPLLNGNGGRTVPVKRERGDLGHGMYVSMLSEPPEDTSHPLHEIRPGIDSTPYLFPTFPSHYRPRVTGTPSSSDSALDAVERNAVARATFDLPVTSSSDFLSHQHVDVDEIPIEPTQNRLLTRRQLPPGCSTSSLDGAVCDKSRDRTFTKAHVTSRGMSTPEPAIASASTNASKGVPQDDREYSSPRPTQRKSKMHECEVCHKQFPRPSGLATHMNSHSGAKPHKCPVPTCNKGFTVRSNAKRHLRTHGIYSLSDPRIPGPGTPEFGFQSPQVASVPDWKQSPKQLQWVSQSETTRSRGKWQELSSPSDSEHDSEREGPGDHSSSAPVNSTWHSMNGRGPFKGQN